MINKEFMRTAAGAVLALSSMALAPNAMAESADCSQFSGKIKHACELSNDLVKLDQQILDTNQQVLDTNQQVLDSTREAQAANKRAQAANKRDLKATSELKQAAQNFEETTYIFEGLRDGSLTLKHPDVIEFMKRNL